MGECAVERVAYAEKGFPTAPKDFVFAKPVVSALSNGIKTFVHNDTVLPKIELVISFKAKSYCDPLDKQGLYTFMCDLLVEGTKNYPGTKLAQEFEKYGMDFAIAPGVLTVRFLSRDFEKGLALVQEVLTNATFEESAVEKIDDHRFRVKSSGEEVQPLIEKMSKSKLNGTSPDEMIAEFGADALRMYELFLTPFDKEKLWQTEGVNGTKRFLNRVYEMITDVDKIIDEEESTQVKKLINRLIKAVDQDLDKLSFNTAIAKMMEFINDFCPLDKYPRTTLKKLTQLIYPFAPHFGEECWQILGGKEKTITYVPFPTYDESYLQDEEVTVVVQVNGKLRGKQTFKRGVSQQQIIAFSKSDQNVKKYLEGEIIKEIYLPDKLLNLVVR